MKAIWRGISRREQRLLQALGIFLLVVVAFSLIWQPTRQRLASAERQYLQQQQLSVQLQQAQPQGKLSAITQPLSLHVSESTTVAGLDIAQMEADNEGLRLTLSGDAKALLQWLDRIEREGVALHSLTLEKRDAVLEARLVLR
ncbi:type II secretion system protein GspM [Pseudomonas sp. PB3P13]